MLVEPLENRNLLATLWVNSFADNTTAGDGMVTLREAIIAANSDGTTDLNNTGNGADTIAFGSIVFATPRTINIDSQLPTIVGDLTIAGPGATMLTINGGNGVDGVFGTGDGSRIFLVNNSDTSQIDVSIRDVSLTGGDFAPGSNSLGGGAILNYENLSLLRTEIRDNATGTRGGGIDNQSTGVLTIDSSTIAGNLAVARAGGGIINNGTLTVRSSTISTNTAVLGGGGLANIGSATLTVNDSTFALNDGGSGDNGISINTSVAIANTIVEDGINLSTSGSVVGSHNLIGVNANLGPLALRGGETRTHELLAGSLAIDAGSSTLTVDQRGGPFTRNDGDGVDIGAYERHAFAQSMFYVTTRSDQVNYSNVNVSLREAINSANGSVGANYISFAPGLFAMDDTIQILKQLPLISDDLTIQGPGAELLTLDAGNGDDGNFGTADGWRIFQVDDGSEAIIDVTIRDLTLTGGDLRSTIAALGGGAILNRENLTLLRTEIRENASDVRGGAIDNQSEGNLTIDSSTVAGNDAVSRAGGGVVNNGTLTILSSTISGNRAALSGGGLANVGAAPITVTDSTFHQNVSESGGGGVFIGSAAAAVNNTIVSDGLVFLTSGTVVGGNNFVGSFPNLGPLLNNGGPTRTHALLAGSAAINAGSSTRTSDQRGMPFSRNNGGGVDIGAYERQMLDPSQFIVTTTNDELDYTNSEVSLREAISNANGSFGANTITFDPILFATPQVIQINSQLPVISDGLTISGTGAKMLTIDAGNGYDNVFGTGTGYRIFEVDSGQAANIAVLIRDLTLTGGDLHSTIATLGGGAILNRENLTLLRTEIRENASEVRGGAIDNQSEGNLTIDSSTVAGNDAVTRAGGGVVNNGTLTILSSTFSGNRAALSGGGLANVGAAPITVTDSTFHQNVSESGGGGVFIGSAAAAVNNTIVSDGLVFLTSGTVVGGNNFVGSFPNLGPLLDNGGPTRTHALLPGSAAINAGSSTRTGDQRGAPFSRNDGGGVDIGAYERQTLDPSLFIVTTTNDELDYSNSDVSLREAINNANGSFGANTISFDPVLFATPQVIQINSQLPVIADGLTISGTGAKMLTIDAGHGFDNTFGTGTGYRIFEVDSGQSANIAVLIRDLTLTGGDLNSTIGTLGGGAILNRENLTLRRLEIRDNASNVRGGAIDNQSEGNLTIDSSTVAGNDAVTRAGGGVVNNGSLTILSSTFSGNHAALGGGGLSNVDAATITINDSTFHENTSDSGTDSIYVGTAAAAINRTIVSSEFGYGTGGSVVGIHNLVGGTPLLGPLLDNGGPTRTHALMPGSPALNASDPAISSSLDQRGVGFERVQLGTADIGAFEVQSILPIGGLVVSTTDDIVDGDFSTGHLSLREAILIANDISGNDTITFSSLFDTAQSIDIVSELPTITDALTIFGPGADLLTIDAHGGGDDVLDGDGFRILSINDGDDGAQINVNIHGLKLTGGDLAGSGGAILNRENLTISNSIISGNRGNDGGGIYLGFGGGTVNSGATLHLIDSTLSGNHAAYGGGAILNSQSATIVNSTISGNSSGFDGGGISNFAGSGSTSTLTIVHSTLSGNSATRDGGGIQNSAGAGSIATVTIANSTLTDNTAASGGGAIRNAAFGDGSSQVMLNNTIVTDDIENAGTLTGDFNLFGTTGATTGGANDIITAVPMLGPLADNGGPTLMHALLLGSPAINAGDPLIVAGFDQRGDGYQRVQLGRSDIGAFEIQLTLPIDGLVVSTTDDMVDADFSAGQLSLREAILFANYVSGPDTITFDASVFSGGASSLIRLTQGELQIIESLTIDASTGVDVVITGDASGDDTLLPGSHITDVAASSLASQLDDNSRVLNFSSATGNLTLQDLTVTGGRTTGDNQGIVTTHSGGGIRFASNDTLTLTSSTVSGNSTAGYFAYGGGINAQEGSVSLTGSTVSGNSTAGYFAYGGGINALEGSVSLTRSTVSGNSTTGFRSGGGGIFANSGDVSLSNSTVSGNSTTGDSADGGGIFANSGDVSLSNSTVSGNSTTGDSADGGGIFAQEGDVSLNSSTVTGNSTAGEGGGIYGAYYYDDSAISIENSIVAGNLANKTPGYSGTPNDLVPDSEGILTINHSLVGVSDGLGTISGNVGNRTGTTASPLDPLLGPLADNGGSTLTHALLPGSPAIDAGGGGETHRYDLNGLLDDALGGPPLDSLGGTLAGGGYQFGPNQGLDLSAANIDPADYTIELVFSFDVLLGYQKIIDFKDLAFDTGLYTLNNQLIFYSGAFSTPGVLTPGVQHHLVLTRDDSTDRVTAFVDGQQIWSFVDTYEDAVFSGTNQIIHFFQDDNSTFQDEAGSGFVDQINIYDGPLSYDQRGAPFVRIIGGRIDIGAFERQDSVEIGGPYTGDEGSPIALSGSASTGATVYDWDLDNDGQYDDATGENVNFVPTDNGVFTVGLRINGPGGLTDSTTVTVGNLAPTAGVAGPSSGVPFQPRTFTLTATDPSSVDQAADFSFDIDWDGDSIIDQTIVGPSSTQIDHAFSSVGSHTVRVTATDKDSGTSIESTHPINIVRVQQQGADLVWGGTIGADTVEFEETAAETIEIRVTLLNGVVVNDTQTFAGVSGRLIAYGGDGGDIIDAGGPDGLSNISATLIGGLGHDTIYGGDAADTIRGDAEGDGSEGKDTIYGGGGDDLIYGDGMEGAADTIMGGDGNDTIYGDNGDISGDGAEGHDVIYGDDGDDLLYGGRRNDTIFGGDGNDTIDGQTGNDILSGGNGNDTLIGGEGKDLLFAGSGADMLNGGGGGDLLVAGTTSFDSNAADLTLIRNEWLSEGDYATRIANLSGTPGGANDPVFLQPGITVLDDADIDTLFGGGDDDWFLDSKTGLIPDILSDLQAGEVETDLAP